MNLKELEKEWKKKQPQEAKGLPQNKVKQKHKTKPYKIGVIYNANIGWNTQELYKRKNVPG